ncbi:MAG TPA: hypothetical protein DDY91_04365 [Planctomycetaceae bacterium]|nr:hypothetical protein [Planctomycetaceae bacterium]
MNDEQALVDEIVRRVLEQLPGVAAVLRSETPAPTLSATPATTHSETSSVTGIELLSPDPPRTEPVFSETNSTGRFLPAPTGWNAPALEVATSTVSVVTTPAPAPITPTVSVAVVPPGAVSSGAGLPASSPPAATPPATTAVADEVTILDRVITAEVLLRDLRGARRVVIAPKALLTPTANDVIRSRRLEVVRQSAQPRTAGVARRRWLVLLGQSMPAVSAAVAAWRASGGVVESALVGASAEAATRAISAVCRGEAEEVLVLSTQPEGIACLVNRNEAVRGVVLSDLPAISRLRESLRPNVWVVDAAPHGGFDLSSLLTQLDR